MKTLLLRASVVVLSVTLGAMAWYVALMPYWLTQSGARDATTFYNQGIGLWLNYTEHVGDPWFDPGNALWEPIQPTGVALFRSQCAHVPSFCYSESDGPDNGTTVVGGGALYDQYCRVMHVYCGNVMTFLQMATSVLAGLALLAVIWSVYLVFTPYRTLIDNYFTQLCIVLAVGFLLVAGVWYFCVFMTIVGTTFYLDQLNRCSTNPTDRSCWSVGTCVYVVVFIAVAYPFLSLLVANHVTEKFRHFHSSLRKLYESSTGVELAAPTVNIKPAGMMESTDDIAMMSFATSNQSSFLQPLQRRGMTSSSDDVGLMSSTSTSSSQSSVQLQPITPGGGTSKSSAKTTVTTTRTTTTSASGGGRTTTTSSTSSSSSTQPLRQPLHLNPSAVNAANVTGGTPTPHGYAIDIHTTDNARPSGGKKTGSGGGNTLSF